MESLLNWARAKDVGVLPRDYEPRRAECFEPERIVFARGARATRERVEFVERIAAVYPEAARIEMPDVPHSRVDLGTAEPAKRLRRGKRTLVFGEHKDAVRFSEEEGNACPNYWHFSPYGFCPFGCKYCYLAGTPGVWWSPTVKVYVNLEEILAGVDRAARRLGAPTAFYLGKLQDGLALDALTAYSTVMVPFFAEHPYARLVALTKCADVERLVTLEHGGHTTLAWSLNPPEVSRAFEENVPAVEARIEAMQRCAAAGYRVRAVVMPIVPVEGWEGVYGDFLRELLAAVPLERLTFGGICSYRHSRMLMEQGLGRRNLISSNFASASEKSGDGRARYGRELRVRIYNHLIAVAREVRPSLDVALCLEEREAWEAVGLSASVGRCNCVL